MAFLLVEFLVLPGLLAVISLFALEEIQCLVAHGPRTVPGQAILPNSLKSFFRLPCGSVQEPILLLRTSPWLFKHTCRKVLELGPSLCHRLIRMQLWFSRMPFNEETFLGFFQKPVACSSDIFLCASAEEVLLAEAAMAFGNRGVPMHGKRKRLPARQILSAGQLSRLEEYEAMWQEARMKRALSGERVPESFFFANLSQHPAHFNRLVGQWAELPPVQAFCQTGLIFQIFLVWFGSLCTSVTNVVLRLDDKALCTLPVRCATVLPPLFANSLVWSEERDRMMTWREHFGVQAWPVYAHAGVAAESCPLPWLTNPECERSFPGPTFPSASRLRAFCGRSMHLWAVGAVAASAIFSMEPVDV